MAEWREGYKGEETQRSVKFVHEDRLSPFRSEDLVEVKGLSNGWLFLLF